MCSSAACPPFLCYEEASTPVLLIRCNQYVTLPFWRLQTPRSAYDLSSALRFHFLLSQFMFTLPSPRRTQHVCLNFFFFSDGYSRKMMDTFSPPTYFPHPPHQLCDLLYNPPFSFVPYKGSIPFTLSCLQFLISSVHRPSADSTIRYCLLTQLRKTSLPP